MYIYIYMIIRSRERSRILEKNSEKGGQGKINIYDNKKQRKI